MISHATPLARLLQLQDALDDTSRDPRGWFATSLTGRGAFPLVNILRNDSGCVVRFEVPGLDPGAISVETQGRTLTVSGKRSHEGAPGSLHRNERWSGEFRRSIELPGELQPSESTAEYRNGVLTIRVPLREEAKPRAITVNAS
jgi:HSP20 family protein